jgi:hypothetical protein
MSVVLLFLTYVAPAWGYGAKTHVNKLHVFQNKVLIIIIIKLARVTPIEGGNRYGDHPKPCQ